MFVEELNLGTLGFEGVVPEATGRPAYHPGVLLKIYVQGYINQIASSRRLEREAQRNVELMWLTGRLAPDFKTIADFRKDNSPAIRDPARRHLLRKSGRERLHSRSTRCCPVARCWPVDHNSADCPVAKARLDRSAQLHQRRDLSGLPGSDCLHDACRMAANCFLADRVRAWISVGGLRQHPTDGARLETGRLRLGHRGGKVHVSMVAACRRYETTDDIGGVCSPPPRRMFAPATRMASEAETLPFADHYSKARDRWPASTVPAYRIVDTVVESAGACRATNRRAGPGLRKR